LGSRQKIEKAIKSVAIDEKTKAKLTYALQAKEFATKNGLDCKNNFGSFVQLKRPYVSYLVVASPKNKIEPKRWSFPIVGSFPYKGFFSKKSAIREIQKLQKKDFDTYMRGVSAYSSLGWFKEPILSSMLKYSKESLAETIFHECFHGTFFVKNNVEINEQLAVFVGHHFLLKFLEALNEKNKVQLEKNSWEDQKLFTAFIEDVLKRAENHYENGSADRESLFTEIAASYKQKLKPNLKVNSYDSVFLKDLNNAKIAAFKTYFHKFENLEKILQSRFKNDIFYFVRETSRLKKKTAQLDFLRDSQIIN